LSALLIGCTSANSVANAAFKDVVFKFYLLIFLYIYLFRYFLSPGVLHKRKPFLKQFKHRDALRGSIRFKLPMKVRINFEVQWLKFSDLRPFKVMDDCA